MKQVAPTELLSKREALYYQQDTPTALALFQRWGLLPGRGYKKRVSILENLSVLAVFSLRSVAILGHADFIDLAACAVFDAVHQAADDVDAEAAGFA